MPDSAAGVDHSSDDADGERRRRRGRRRAGGERKLGRRSARRSRDALVERASSAVRKRYLTRRDLERLAAYTNSGSDLSWSYRFVLSPVYDRLVHALPRWLAPNAVTLIGLCGVLLAHALVLLVACGGGMGASSHRSPGDGLLRAIERDGRADRWSVLLGVGQCADSAAARAVYAFASLALLSYQALDNLDGRQARRTGSSSPLGHLFDHGCDALNVTITGVSFAAVAQFGPTLWGLLLFWALGMAPFFFATLEEYFTGALVLREINGPNEGLLFMEAFLMATAVCGPSMWTRTLVLPVLPHAVAARVPWMRLPRWLVRWIGSGGFLQHALSGGLSVNASMRARLADGTAVALPANRILVLLALVLTPPTVFANMWSTVWRGRSRHGHVGKRKRNAFLRAQQYSGPFVLLSASMFAWALASPTVLTRHAVAFVWLCGLTFFYSVSRLILAHLTWSMYGSSFPALTPLALGALNALAGSPLPEALMVRLGCALMLVTNARRVHGVITEISSFLGVRTLVLRKPARSAGADAGGEGERAPARDAPHRRDAARRGRRAAATATARA